MTFIRCVKSFNTFDPARGRLFDWLKAIARNEAQRLFRQGAPAGQVALDSLNDQWLEQMDQGVQLRSAARDLEDRDVDRLLGSRGRTHDHLEPLHRLALPRALRLPLGPQHPEYVHGRLQPAGRGQQSGLHGRGRRSAHNSPAAGPLGPASARSRCPGRRRAGRAGGASCAARAPPGRRGRPGRMAQGPGESVRTARGMGGRGKTSPRGGSWRFQVEG